MNKYSKNKKVKNTNKSEHYYSKKPISKNIKKKIEVSIKRDNKSLQFSLTTASGVFGKNKADIGSVLLIENAIIKNEKEFKVLDMGCGYGIVGISLKKLFKEVDITCSDINERAVQLTKTNAQRNKIEIDCIQSDLFENIENNFNTILINLPQNAGKNICFEMIEQSYNHLEKDGTLQVVSRHQKGGKTYEKKMIEIFGNSEYIGKGSGYRVYLSKKEQ